MRAAPRLLGLYVAVVFPTPEMEHRLYCDVLQGYDMCCSITNFQASKMVESWEHVF